MAGDSNRTETINVASQFSPNPLGRFRKQGRFSGEAFREDFLRPALARAEKVVVVLDGTGGLSTGFLDESFAGLIREGVLTEAEFWNRIEIVSDDDPLIITEIRNFVTKAARRRESN